MAKKSPTPNDQKSIVKNPNNEQFDLDLKNREKQIRENQHLKTKKSK